MVGNSSDSERRRLPRYVTRHRVDGVSVSPPLAFRGVLYDLSGSGCCLFLDTLVPPESLIEARCNLHGLGLRLRGVVVWAERLAGGVLHGVMLTGFGSKEDTLLHRLYVGRLGRQADANGERRSAEEGAP